MGCSSVRLVANRPDMPVIVMTAFGNLESAIAAIRAGAYDFVTKPIEMELLAVILRRAVERRQLQQQIRSLREAVQQAGRFEDLLGQSPPMLKLYDQLAQISDSEASVLIMGESGTGKEVVARGLHQHSKRRDKPFVAVNVAALPDTLLESELFGHMKGAFTDARNDRKGLLPWPRAGRCFSMKSARCRWRRSPSCCGPWRRARSGRSAAKRRLPSMSAFWLPRIATWKRPSMKAVSARTSTTALTSFRSTCRHGRGGTDTLLLAQHFIELYAARTKKQVEGISAGVAEKLLAYSWPGNVRELRNVIERAVALTRLGTSSRSKTCPRRSAISSSSQVVIGGSDPGELVPLEEVESDDISSTSWSAFRAIAPWQPGSQAARARSQDPLSQTAAVRRAAGWGGVKRAGPQRLGRP